VSLREVNEKKSTRKNEIKTTKLIVDEVVGIEVYLCEKLKKNARGKGKRN
jgi:hypothetical protein